LVHSEEEEEEEEEVVVVVVVVVVRRQRDCREKGESMAVLITAVVPGQTQEGYDAAMRTLRPLLEQAEGFIGHGAGISPEGWRVFEIWETQQQATEFFAKYIHPNLPPGVTPKRTYLELHNLMLQPKAENAHS
jgi:hypothetical protein